MRSARRTLWERAAARARERPRNAARAALFALACAACALDAKATDVAVCTDQGRFVIALADAEAPQHVENFLRYVDMAYYSGTVFHRVMPNFVVQGGGLDRELRGRPTLPPVQNESNNGLRNRRGTVAAARATDPDSAAAQFFVNLADNTALDAGREPGYTVFGRVTEGMDVVDAIGRLPTGPQGPLKSDVPMPLVAIKSIARLDEQALGPLPADGREAALKQRIIDAVAAGDYRGALEWVSRYRTTCADDPEVAVLEARSALEINDRRRATFVLEEYFATADRSDATYDRALELYRQAVPEDEQSATQLLHDCETPVAPEIPDGNAATLEEMLAGQSRVKAFEAAGEEFIACLTKIIDDRERGAADRNAAIGEHNRMVGEMERVAEAFNTQLKAFKARN